MTIYEEGLEQYMSEVQRLQKLQTMEDMLKFVFHTKSQQTLDNFIEWLGNPREIANLKIEQIKSYQVLEKGDKLSIEFELI